MTGVERKEMPDLEAGVDLESKLRGASLGCRLDACIPEKDWRNVCPNMVMFSGGFSVA